MSVEVHDSPIQFITDAEKAYAFFARMLDLLGDIRDSVAEADFPIDMYGSDPGGQWGIIAQPFKPNGSAQIFTNYNGPYIIDSILATWAVGEATGQSITNTGSVTAPAAGGTITSVSVPAGTYQVSWEVSLAGTPAAADANNFQLNAGTVVVASDNPGTVGGPFAQVTEEVTVTSASTFSIKAIGVGTAGAIYTAQISATPVIATPTTVTLLLKDRTLQLPAEAGLINPQQLAIQMDRDDQIVLTVTPKAACHLEIMGHVDKRKTNYLS